METLMIVFLVVIVLVGAGVLFLISYGRKGGKMLDVDKYRSNWLTIEQQMTKDNEHSCHMAILNADKLLDKALKESGYKGETMGERMKSAKDTWSNANNVWLAHKLRNRIAHEPNVRVTYNDARRMLSLFKQALKDLKAI